MIKHKKISYILIAVVILGMAFEFINASKADTQSEDKCPNGYWDSQTGECITKAAYVPGGQPGKNTVPPGGPSATLCIPVPTLFSFKGCIFVIGYYTLWKPASLFMNLGGLALNKSIDLSINSSALKYLTQSKDSAVTAGWGLARDIVNIFLIFIVLYIAIATILQISGYGAKELLATLIVIAFLVNFSLVITKLIIDASNILAMEFYNSFPKSADGGGVAISEGFKEALGLEKIAIDENAIKTADGAILLLGVLYGTCIALIAGFIFLVFAVLFFIRMVSLMILMIFAPLAFAAHVLPSTNKHAHKWWDYLFSQAFFAPTALFMLWLSAKIAKSGFIENSLGLKLSNTGFSDMVKNFADKTASISSRGEIVTFTVQYAIIAILLCFSLVIAKQMGAMGAESVQKGLTKAGKKMQGYAGRIGRRYAAGAAERIAAGEGKFAKTIRAIPFATRGLAQVSAGAKAEVAEYEKKYDSYSTGVLKNLSTQLGTNRAAQTAILNILAKRGKLEDQGRFNKEFIKSVMNRPEAPESLKNDIIRKRPDVASSMQVAVKLIRPSDISDLRDSVIDDLPDKKEFFTQAVTTWSPGHIQEIVKKGGKIFNEYSETLKEMTKQMGGDPDSATDIANMLRNNQNQGTARWIESEAGISLMGFKAGKKTPPSPFIEVVTSTGGGKRTPEQQRRMEELREEATPPSRPPLASPPKMPPPPKPEV